MKDYGKIISIRLPTWLYIELKKELEAEQMNQSGFIKYLICKYFIEKGENKNE